MKNRRKFLRNSLLGTSAFLAGGKLAACSENPSSNNEAVSTTPSKINKGPLVISTWAPNVKANEAAWQVINKGGYALDAAEAGARVPEADPDDRSVGYGGRPDREGRVTLDACIMDEHSNGGAVVFLEHIKHPISVARKVMTETPHMILAGEGALNFALSQGFSKENLLIEASEKEYDKWLKNSEYKPIINIENHDTIGILTLDKEGKFCGACTTSGAAYKMQGRVGDSPIFGAGLYVDGEVGGAAATGLGEAVLKVCGSHLVVEFMRQGKLPEEACKMAVERVISKEPAYKELQVGFIAANLNGEYGGYSIQKGFSFAVHNSEGPKTFQSNYSFHDKK